MYDKGDVVNYVHEFVRISSKKKIYNNDNRKVLFVNIHQQSCFGSILKLGHIPNKEFWWHVSTFKTCLLGVNTVEAREQSLCGACCSIYLP